MMRGVWARERERSIQGIDCEWGKEIQKQTSSAQCSRAFKEKLIFHCRRARIGIGIGIGTDAKWQQEVPTRGWYRTNARKGKGKAGKGKRCCFVRLVAWCFHGWLLNRVVPAQAAPSNKIRSRSRSRGHTGCSPFWPISTPFPIVRAAADAGCQKLMLTRRFPFDLVTRLPQRARPALLLRRNQWQKAFQISLFDLRFFSFLPLLFLLLLCRVLCLSFKMLFALFMAPLADNWQCAR